MADGADVAYSFPMLNSKKIVGYLGDLNIHVSEQVSCDALHSCTRCATSRLLYQNGAEVEHPELAPPLSAKNTQRAWGSTGPVGCAFRWGKLQIARLQKDAIIRLHWRFRWRGFLPSKHQQKFVAGMVFNVIRKYNHNT